MLHNPVTAALRDISRDWFYSGVMILGLAAGFAAAMLIALYLQSERSFERFIPGHERVYRLETDIPGAGAEPQHMDTSLASAAAQIALDFPEVEQVARLALTSRWVGKDEPGIWERVAWVDPDFFDALPFPVLAGDPVAAMHDPNGVVLTRAMAQKHFGQDAPIGETLLVQAPSGEDPTVRRMVVRAVLRDPGETHLEQFKIFASGLAAWTRLAELDRRAGTFPSVFTYVRLRSGVLADDVIERLPAFAASHYSDVSFRLEAISDLHLTATVRAVNAGIAAVGFLIIVVAAINFVTLVTARGTRRAVEVGVRKTLGARRRELIVLFIGEALVYVLVALVLSVVLVKLALPPINVFLERAITFDLLSDLALTASIVGVALLTGLISGLYPAMVLSGVRPASALKGGSRQMGSAQVRQTLVVIQFAILTGLIIVATTIWRQTAFLIDDLERLNEDQVLVLEFPCEQAFKQELMAIPGVSAVSCVSLQAANPNGIPTTIRDPVGEAVTVNTAPIDVGFFELHGLSPLAGRFFSEDRGQDMVADHADPEAQPTVVLNESAVRLLGLESPEAAVGMSLDWQRPFAAPRGSPPVFRSSEVVGVVPDFSLPTLLIAIRPTMYYVDLPATDMIFARFDESRLTGILRSMDDLWRRTGQPRPMYWEILGDSMRLAFHDVIVQRGIIAASTGLAILIACLGLFALVVFTTERQTKEIGVRKVMGASSLDVVRLLLWRFTKPVLWANVIAWPFAFWASSHWLEGFAYRVSLPFWLFLAASASALLLAWATIGTKTWFAAHARPATAIRHE